VADTIREQILEWLKAHLESMQDGSPVADPYSVQFSVVSREPIDKLATGKQYAISIFEGAEDKSDRIYPFMECTLALEFEFHAYVGVDQVRSTILNKVLGELQRRLREDKTCGGLAIDLVEDSNTFDIEGPYDRQAVGVLVMALKYRHNIDDPRTAV
jgi:hypothetical protein